MLPNPNVCNSCTHIKDIYRVKWALCEYHLAYIRLYIAMVNYFIVNLNLIKVPNINKYYLVENYLDEENAHLIK